MAQVEVNGLRIGYDVMGDGPPLLMIMGLGAQRVFWPERFCELFVDAGYQVIRFDNRDVGESTRLDDAPRPDVRRAIAQRWLRGRAEAPYDLSDMAADAVGLLDALGIASAHVMGASMGGMIAQTLAIESPQRLRSLTSIMSTTGQRRWSLARPRALRVLLRRPPLDLEGYTEAMVEFFRVCGSPGFASDELALRARVAEAHARGVNPAGTARQLAAIMASGSRARALRKVKAPTLVVHGTRDPLVPPGGGRATARAIRGARLLMIDGMGHDLPEDTWQTMRDAFVELTRRARP